MQLGNRCVKCMQERGTRRFCGRCGYDNENPKNPERALPIGTVLNGKYLLGAVVGEGGFGVTYAAWDTLIGIRVAIKEYFPSELVTRDATVARADGNVSLQLALIQSGEEERYQRGLARFVEEAGKLARFGHLPGIVSVKDFFYENQTAYMVMEYIDGVTLDAYLGELHGKLVPEDVFRMMEPVIRTLQEIHKAGIIHRDISPDNLMLTRDGQIKLIDFGAARFVGGESEKSLTVMLKHGYAPEEQYRSEGKQGAWTDVYAFCAVMYRMLTGKSPEEIARRIMEKKDGVHEELKHIPNLSKRAQKGLEQGLAVQADKRLQTMGALYDAIYGESRGNLWKWALGVDVALAVLVCGLVFGIVGRRKEEEKIPVLEEPVQEEMDLAEEDLGPEEPVEEQAVEEEPEEIFSYSEEELVALIEEKSGKIVFDADIFIDYSLSEGYVYRRVYSACYDDFDGDGRFELFAYVVNDDDSIEDKSQLGTGQAIWFSNGEETAWVQDLTGDNYFYLVDAGVLQFGKNKHFYIIRDTGHNATSLTTTCALDDGRPHVVIQDEGVSLLSENGKTYCSVFQWNQYASYIDSSYTENYAIFYREGEYWEYASKMISEDVFQQYSNGTEILSLIKEKAGTLYENVQWDFSLYPYIEVENVLLNSENDEIIVNMRHWKCKEDADYYKSLEDTPTGLEVIVSLPSEARLSVQDDSLQIEEVKYGHKEEKGTEFRPFYPD